MIYLTVLAYLASPPDQFINLSNLPYTERILLAKCSSDPKIFSLLNLDLFGGDLLKHLDSPSHQSS